MLKDAKMAWEGSEMVEVYWSKVGKWVDML